MAMTTVDGVAAIRKARVVYVAVSGPDDIFYAKISKSEAIRLLHEAQGQLEVSVGYEHAYVEARI